MMRALLLLGLLASLWMSGAYVNDGGSIPPRLTDGGSIPPKLTDGGSIPPK